MHQTPSIQSALFRFAFPPPLRYFTAVRTPCYKTGGGIVFHYHSPLSLPLHNSKYLKTNQCLISTISNNEIIKNNENFKFVDKIETPLQLQHPPSSSSNLTQYIKHFGILSKDKLSLWVALSTIPGVFLAASNPPITVLTSLLLGTFLTSSSAASFNQIIESKKDKLMIRTKNRPLVNGKLSPKDAITFGCVAAVGGTSILLFGTSPLTAAIAASNICLYALVYTPMKTVTPFNTHVGSVVGSLPILLGYTAVGSSLALPAPWVLFAIQLLWQFPHFYALAWLHKNDYIRANFKMFPLSDDSGKVTALRCKRYSWALIAVPFLTSFGGLTSWMFVVDALLPNLLSHYYLLQFEKAPSKSRIRTFFAVQLWQLLVLLVLTVYHTKAMSRHTVQHPFDGEAVESTTSNDPFYNIRNTLINKCPHMLLRGLSESCFYHIAVSLLPFYTPPSWYIDGTHRSSSSEIDDIKLK